MFQVRKSSRIFGISAIFFQCCFISETQILMVVSTFSDFISRNHFLAGGFICKSGVVFQLGGLHFLIYLFIHFFLIFFLGGEGIMKIIMSPPPPPPPPSSRENLANRAQYLIVKLKKILHLVLKIHTKARNEPKLSINTRQ